MSSLTHFQRSSSDRLLRRVLEQPQLLAAVRELPPPALVRLIHRVGLEDAGELIALTSTEQLGQVFDAELWQAAEPGADESFQPERFALYLHLMFEAGDAFVAERLLALPRPLLTLAFHKLLLVIDIDALTVRFNSAGRFFDDDMDRVAQAIDDAQFEEWEEFRLIARDPSAFDDAWNALLLIDREDHALARALVERCCDMDGELIEESGLYAVLNEEEVLENDLTAERSERRAAAGHVAPADARAFLELGRRELEEESEDGRDALSRAYFRELAPASVERPSASPNVVRLLAALNEGDVGEERAHTSRRRAGARQLTLMARAMLVLRRGAPALHTQRTEEVGFLANVLIAGSQHDGRAYRPVEAIECALTTCSVGLWEEQRRRSGARRLSVAEAATLLGELGAERLFRIGVRALRREVGDRARTLRPLEGEPLAAEALAALCDAEPWLAGSLAIPGRLFVAPRDLGRIARFLAQ